jgi:hypothetical protein
MRTLVHLLFGLALLGNLGSASACSMIDAPTDEELFAKASAVFVAHIYRTEEVGLPGFGGSPARPAVEATLSRF